jgi:hypothetical protein
VVRYILSIEEVTSLIVKLCENCVFEKRVTGDNGELIRLMGELMILKQFCS